MRGKGRSAGKLEKARPGVGSAERTGLEASPPLPRASGQLSQCWERWAGWEARTVREEPPCAGARREGPGQDAGTQGR